MIIPKKEIVLDESMLSTQDIDKLLTAGNHTITVFYKGKETTFNIILKEHTFDEIAFNDKVVTYTGEEFELAVSNMPTKAIVSYDKPNKYISLFFVSVLVFGEAKRADLYQDKHTFKCHYKIKFYKFPVNSIQ